MGLRSSCFLSRRRSTTHRRIACRSVFALGALLLAAACLALPRLPWWIEQRLRASLIEKGYRQVELKVTRTGWRDMDLAGLRLAGPGWIARATAATLQFRPLPFLKGTYEALELTGLKVDVDLEPLLQGQGLRLPATLQALHRANRYGLVRFHDARFRLQRGDAVEHLQVAGDFRTQGPVALTISGEGTSAFSLRIEGEMAGDRGDALLHAGLRSASLAPLLATMAPGWLQKNPVYSVDGVELVSSLRFTANRPFVTDAGGVMQWTGWQFDNGRVAPARIHVQKQGDAVVLRSETLALQREDGLAARGFAEATFAPEGSAEDTPFLQGRLHVESCSSPEMTLKPFTIPFAGTPANLRLGPTLLTMPGSPVEVLRDLWVRLENPPNSPFRAEGKALLDVPLPSPLPRALPAPVLRLPATGSFQGPHGNRTLDFAIHADDGRGNPLRLNLGACLVQLSATLTGTIPPGPPPRAIPLHLDLPRLACFSEDRPLLAISTIALTGHSRNGLVEAAGTGVLEGESFPLRLSQSAGAPSPPAAGAMTTALSLGPIPLRDAAWPGNLIRAWRGTRASGELLVEGTLQHQPASSSSLPRPDLAIRLRDGELVYPEESAKASGVQATARLISLLPPLLAPGMIVTADRISAGKLELSRMHLAATFSGPGHARLDSFEAGLLGGVIRIAEPVIISQDASSFTILFDLSRIQAAEAVRLFPKFKGRVTASISGQVPLVVENGTPRFLEGHLYLDGSQPAHLSYDASGFLTSGKGGRKPKFTQAVERALGNLTIQSLDVRLFDPADPAHPAILKLAGLGVDGQLNLPVNLTIPVEDEEGILQSLFSRILSTGMNVLRPQ